MPLFQRRRQQREKAERVARGESVKLTTTFEGAARNRLLYAMMENAPDDFGDVLAPRQVNFMSLVRSILITEWGKGTLANKPRPDEDLLQFVAGRATDDEVLDAIEAVFQAYDKVNASRDYPRFDQDHEANAFRAEVNRILDEHDIAYEVIGREIVPRESATMHANVVVPALSLLRGDERLASVEKSYHDALRELKPGGDPSDAITDAARALQEMLVALGAKGDTLGSLLTSAHKKGLLGRHDSKLAQGMENIGEWVSADRSARGDAHHVREATVDDAWLAIHVVGALIVRLAKRL